MSDAKEGNPFVDAMVELGHRPDVAQNVGRMLDSLVFLERAPLSGLVSANAVKHALACYVHHNDPQPLAALVRDGNMALWATPEAREILTAIVLGIPLPKGRPKAKKQAKIEKILRDVSFLHAAGVPLYSDCAGPDCCQIVAEIHTTNARDVYDWWRQHKDEMKSYWEVYGQVRWFGFDADRLIKKANTFIKKHTPPGKQVKILPSLETMAVERGLEYPPKMGRATPKKRPD